MATWQALMSGLSAAGALLSPSFAHAQIPLDRQSSTRPVEALPQPPVTDYVTVVLYGQRWSTVSDCFGYWGSAARRYSIMLAGVTTEYAVDRDLLVGTRRLSLEADYEKFSLVSTSKAGTQF